MPGPASPSEDDGWVDKGGKSVQDFQSEGIVSAVRRSLRLLEPGRRRLFLLASAIQVSLGVLDLVGIVLVGLLASVAISATGLSNVPAGLQGFLDAIGLSGLTATQLSVALAGSAVIVLIAKTVLSAILARRIFRFLANRQAEVASQLARRFLNLPLLDVQRWTTSEAIYALGSGVGAAVVIVLGSAVTIAAEIFLFFIVGITLLAYDFLVTLIALGTFAVMILLVNRVLTRWGARNAQIMTDSSIHMLSAVSEALETYRETTVMNRRDLYIDRYQRLIGRYAAATANQSYVLEIPKYALEATLYLAILVLAVFQFLTKDLATAAATVAVFLAAGTRVVPALLRLQGAYINARNGSVSAMPTYYLSDFLQRKESVSTPITSRSTSDMAALIAERIRQGHQGFEPRIEVRAVSVRYLDAEEPALRGVDVTIPPGTSVALVGSTGAGKSTLADIILGVLEPDEGEVLLGSVPPRAAIDRWPGSISYVPQSVALVYGTVRDNVALGLPRDAVDDELVWEALSRARIDDFLRESRDGLDTAIGERGVRLSGGQRQRLGIARALYTRPLMLVLDEATSALDAETEQSIVQTLNDLEGQVTTVTVAHRLATVRRADLLLYLESGRIVAQGSFGDVRRSVPDFDRQAALLGL